MIPSFDIYTLISLPFDYPAQVVSCSHCLVMLAGMCDNEVFESEVASKL